MKGSLKMSNKKQTQKGPITTMHKVMVVIVSLLAAFAFGLAFGTVSKSLIIGIVAGITLFPKLC